MLATVWDMSDHKLVELLQRERSNYFVRRLLRNNISIDVNSYLFL
jgi:hypothetical protein